jgi:uncharacterized protein YfbU (UPF0304 family)
MLTAILFGFSACETISKLDIPGLPLGSTTNELDESTIISGLKEALEVGARKAVDFLSVYNGFFGNPELKILLPEEFDKIDSTLRKIGFSRQMDEFEETMNHAAEEACALAVDIFIDAINHMSFSDAWNILNGPDDAATRYLESHYRMNLYDEFFPVVKNTMDNVGLTQMYKTILTTYNSLPLVEKREYDLDVYITNKALDALFLIVEREEKAIRTDPAARITDLLKKVFG